MSGLKQIVLGNIMITKGNRFNRRHFLKGAALGSFLSPLFPACGPLLNVAGTVFSRPGTPVRPIVSQIKSTVTMVSHRRAVHSETQIDEAVVLSMLEEGLIAQVGKATVEECWLEIFPSLKASDVIGLKINSGSHLPTHRELVNAIIASLLKAGIKENNIIVWDRCDTFASEGLIKCGYKINCSDKGVRYMATNMEGVGYDKDVRLSVPSAKISFPLTRIISQYCDYLISVPVLKGGRGAYGVTGSMKNYYGAIPLGDRPNPIKISLMHSNNASPQIAEVYSHPLIRDKTKLCIYDALLGRFSGGPAGRPQFINNQLILGTDPVAVDYQGLMIVEKERAKRGLPSVMAYPGYIQNAAEMGLGTNNPEQIDLQEIVLGPK